MTKHSNYIFRGKLVDMRKHWDGDAWELLNSISKNPIIIGTQEQIEHLYDTINEMDDIPDIDTIKKLCCTA